MLSSLGVHLLQAVGPDRSARHRNDRLHPHRVHGMEEAAHIKWQHGLKADQNAR